MKTKILSILFLLIISVYNVFPFDVEIIDEKFEVNYFMDMNKAKGKTLLLCAKQRIPNSLYYAGSVLIYENEKWTKLPDTVEIGSVRFPLELGSGSTVGLDSSGAIWVSGKFLYKYLNSKWEAYLINDSDKDYRTYLQFCIDKFNNLWITTTVYYPDPPYNQHSEIFRFNGEKFERVLDIGGFGFAFHCRNSYGLGRSSVISALPDGKVIAIRTLFIGDSDVTAGKTEELYIFDQDLSYHRIKLKTPSGTDFDNYNKIVSSFFPEPDGKVWICLAYMTLTDEYGTTCCSGLVLFDNGNWTIFDENNGFEKEEAYPKEVYKPIYFMVKLNSNDYLLLGGDKFYWFRNYYVVDKKLWADVLSTHCKFIVPNSKMTVSKVNNFLQRLVNYGDPLFPPYWGFILQDNGDLWIHFSDGILIIKSNIFLNIDEDFGNESFIIYPNPCQEKVFLNPYLKFCNFQIINTLGIVIKEGLNIDNQIDVSNLPGGLYFLKLFNYSSHSIFQKLIKTK